MENFGEMEVFHEGKNVFFTLARLVGDLEFS